MQFRKTNMKIFNQKYLHSKLLTKKNRLAQFLDPSSINFSNEVRADILPKQVHQIVIIKFNLTHAVQLAIASVTGIGR